MSAQTPKKQKNKLKFYLNAVIAYSITSFLDEIKVIIIYIRFSKKRQEDLERTGKNFGQI